MPNEIFPGMFIADLALALPEQKLLAVADVHLGYEGALSNSGVHIPTHQLKDTVKRIEPLLKQYKPKTIVVNGDLKHEFGTISDKEWKDTLKFIDLLRRYAEKIVLVKGNHDTVLDKLVGKRGLEVVSHYKDGATLFLHGDKEPDKKLLKGVKTIVIGHEHPAVGLREGERIEVFKCWLVGELNRNIIVMPSFNVITEGSDVLKEKPLSPLLKGHVNDFLVYVVDDEGDILPFGRVGGLR